MHVVFAFMIFAGLISGFHPFAASPPGELNLAVGTNEALRIYHTVTPLSETTHACLLKQNYDYSCGSAALGTILNSYLGENFTEKQIIHGLMEYGDKEQIKKLRAFSLWDMQKFVDVLGYKAGGYNAELSDLKNPELWPCIVPIELFGYRHFVVLKAIHKDRVFVADPWRGNGSYTIDQFMKMWYNNILFRVYPKYNRGLTCLSLTEKDLRFVDKDMEKSLMFDVDRPFDLPREWEAVFHKPNTNEFRYKN
ncbi:C39 family peptidase [Desulfatiferula olefinivorans]